MVWVDEKELKEMIAKEYALWALIYFLISLLCVVSASIVSILNECKWWWFVTGMACGMGLLNAIFAVYVMLKNRTG